MNSNETPLLDRCERSKNTITATQNMSLCSLLVECISRGFMAGGGGVWGCKGGAHASVATRNLLSSRAIPCTTQAQRAHAWCTEKSSVIMIVHVAIVAAWTQDVCKCFQVLFYKHVLLLRVDWFIRPFCLLGYVKKHKVNIVQFNGGC